MRCNLRWRNGRRAYCARDTRAQAAFASPCSESEILPVLLQLRVLCLGFFQDRDVGIGVLPEREEISVGSECPDAGGIGIALPTRFSTAMRWPEPLPDVPTLPSNSSRQMPLWSRIFRNSPAAALPQTSWHSLFRGSGFHIPGQPGRISKGPGRTQRNGEEWRGTGCVYLAQREISSFPYHRFSEE
jgi:hypothetical protein